jgi:hypothetical protein
MLEVEQLVERDRGGRRRGDLPRLEAVTMPFGWLTPVPVVLRRLAMRPRRSPIRSPSNGSTPNAESCASSMLNWMNGVA